MATDYVLRDQSTFAAIQYGPETCDDCHDLVGLGRHGALPDCGMAPINPGGGRTIKPGDWIVSFRSVWEVLDDEAFHERYVRADIIELPTCDSCIHWDGGLDAPYIGGPAADHDGERAGGKWGICTITPLNGPKEESARVYVATMAPYAGSLVVRDNFACLLHETPDEEGVAVDVG